MSDSRKTSLSLPSQPSSSSSSGNVNSYSTRDSLSLMTVKQLKEFLRSKGPSVRLSGLKSELLKRALLYFDQPSEITPNEPTLVADQEELIQPGLDWKDIEHFKSSYLPGSFSREVVESYLLEDLTIIDGDREITSIGAKKAARKGRDLYLSNKVHLMEFASKTGILLFRGNLESSLDLKTFYFPAFSLSSSGRIKAAKCTCKAQADSRCAHIGAIMHLVEELIDGNTPRIFKPSTSQPQYFGKGSSRAADPGPVNLPRYGKKRRTDRFMYDPRPEGFQKTSREELDSFIKSFQSHRKPTMFENVLKFHYEDYPLSSERYFILQGLVKSFISNLSEECHVFEDSQLSSDVCWHMDGTEDQSLSSLWHQKRRGRITASSFKKFTANPFSFCQKLWDSPVDLSKIPAIAWGQNHEKEALSCYEKKCKKSVTPCGLFVSKRLPFIGASPDGLLDSESLVEVKCPYMLKDAFPWDLDKLNVSQKSSFCCTLTADKKLVLKRSHPYFTQIQVQMMVTGRKTCDFIIWTPKSLHVETIPYDRLFLDPLLEKAAKSYQNIVVPEYFENRQPRRLSVFDLGKVVK